MVNSRRISRTALSTKNLPEAMGVMTCTQLREYLEDNTEMSHQERIVFIEQNMQSTSTLRSYIAKQHMSMKDLNFYATAGKSLMTMVGTSTTDMMDYFVDRPMDDADPDCEYLKDLLETSYRLVGKSAKETVSMYQKLKTMAESAYTTAKKWTGKVANLAIFFAKYMAQWAFKIGQWIMSNPKTAFFSLMVLKGLKTQLCRQVGKIVGYFGESTDRSWMMSKIRQYYKGPLPSGRNSTARDMYNVAQDALKPVVIDAVGGAAKSIMGALWDNSGSILKSAVVASLSAIPFAGPALASVGGLIVDGALNASKESAQMALEQAIYTRHVNNAFGQLFELVDPISCMKEVFNEFSQTLTNAAADLETSIKTRSIRLSRKRSVSKRQSQRKSTSRKRSKK